MRKIKNWFSLISIVLSLLTISGCIEDTLNINGEKKSYFVKNVIDGDTIELSNGKRVRYIGINTPETRKRVGDSWVYDPQPYAVEATIANKGFVEQKNVLLEFDVQKEDKYNRWLAYVYIDDKMVNEELLSQGYGKVLVIPPNTKYYDLFKSAEREARQFRRGIFK
ncbi:MAG: thermonuclease family protein [Candidatus Omnitrophota bacterium]